MTELVAVTFSGEHGVRPVTEKKAMRKKHCKFGVNKRTGRCLKTKRKRKSRR